MKADPYRFFFPLGAWYAIAGAGIWTLAALGVTAYPATLHRMLMIEGFEQCFILGFLLTAIPGLLHAERARASEMGMALAALVAFGAFAFSGLLLAAHVAYFASLVVIAIAALRRVPRATQPPPVEFLFVMTGLLFGLAGALMLVLEAAGTTLPGPVRFADRLLSLGMVLSLVLGVGGLLVPTFTGMRNPLEIPFLAASHERPPRIRLYVPLALALLAAFVLEWSGRAALGGVVRALAGTVVLLLVWKLFRGPGRRDLSAFAMWGAGWMVLAGLWLLVLLPQRPWLGMHVIFVGGFGLLTFAIATRVVIAHGRHGLPAEPIVLSPPVAVALALAFGARVAGELVPAYALHLHGTAGALWALAWLIWAKEALPRIVRVKPATSVLIAPPTLKGPGPATPGVTGGPR